VAGESRWCWHGGAGVEERGRFEGGRWLAGEWIVMAAVGIDAGVVVRDPVTGLFGLRVELGHDRSGVRMQARRGGFTTERAALAEHLRLARLRDARRRRPRLSDTVRTVCEDWLVGRVQELQPNTVYNYGWLLSLVYPHVGRVRVSRLSARTVDLVLAKALGEQTGRTLGAHKPREADEARPVWTLAEARRFLDYVSDDRLYPLWRLLLTTGLRRGELCGLKWSDLEPDLATLTVRRQRVVEDPSSRVREKPPKSHNGVRSLLLDPVTVQVLTGTRPQATMARVSGYLFTGRAGLPLRPDTVSNRFNRLAAEAGVRPLGPHQIRHLLAGSLLDTGYGIAEVAERLGHDPATLMRYYSRVNADRRRQAAEHVADLLSAEAPPEPNESPPGRSITDGT
jgi:integrase